MINYDFVFDKDTDFKTVKLTNLSILPETDDMGFFYARAEYEYKTLNGLTKKLIIPKIELPFNKNKIPNVGWHFHDRKDRKHVRENKDGFYYLAFENAALPLRKASNGNIFDTDVSEDK